MKIQKSHLLFFGALTILIGISIFLIARQSNDEPATSPVLKLVKVVDGDTFDVQDESGLIQRVRPVGYDTPEPGQCGFSEATKELEAKLTGKEISLVLAGTADKDMYGRLLRYVEVDGRDIGLELIKGGFAVAAYDSRTKYPKHFREDEYIAADEVSPNLCD